MRIRGGSGLGDSIYLRSIAGYFIRQGDAVTVCSNYPDAFIDSGALVEPFRRDRIDTVCHYTAGKNNQNTNQFEDMCASAGGIKTELKFDWQVKNTNLVKSIKIKSAGRPVVIVHGGRPPMDRADGFGVELIPDQNVFNSVLDELKECFLVRIGRGRQIYQLKSDLDLSDKTSITDVFDIASVCKGIVSQCSFMVPLAESFDKPLLAIWSHRGLSSGRHQYISSITPRKILSKESSGFIVDDFTQDEIRDSINAFRKF